MEKFKKQSQRMQQILGIFLVSLLLFLLFSSFFQKERENSVYAFEFLTNDSVSIQVYKIFDSDSVLTNYKARIFTPVCEDGECRAVELDFYWDELGNFEKYELLPGKELTKREHDAFTEEDYAFLQNLLQKREVAFQDYKREDLIKDIKADTLDAYSGATIASIKSDIIPGAVYSCFTLWHIAQGEVRDRIKTETEKHLSKVLLTRMLAANDAEKDDFVIGYFPLEFVACFHTELCGKIRTRSGYFAKNAFENLPLELISREDFQNELASIFSELDVFARKALYNRLKGNLRSKVLTLEMIKKLNHRSSSENSSILNLVLETIKTKNLNVYKALIEYLVSEEISVNKQQLRLINELAKENTDFGTILKSNKYGIKKRK